MLAEILPDLVEIQDMQPISGEVQVLLVPEGGGKEDRGKIRGEMEWEDLDGREKS